MFLASNAGMWSWSTKNGIYIARSCHEGRNRFRQIPLFMVQYYEWNPKKNRFRRPIKIKEIFPLSDLEADLYLAQLVDKDLSTLVDYEIEEGFPPSIRYSKTSRGFSWQWAKENGLYIATFKIERYYGYNTKLSFKPFNMSKRWTTLYENKFLHDFSDDKEFQLELINFRNIVTNIDDFLMYEKL